MSTSEQETKRRILTPEERARRYAELRQKSALGAIYARHRDPNMYVRWVRDDRRDIAIHKHLGFVFATDDPRASEEKRRIDTTVELEKDGFYRTGDVILMEIDRDAYEFYCQESVERSKAQRNVGKESFLHEAAKLDIDTFELEKRGKKIRR